MSKSAIFFGALFLLLGVGVFAIRLIHTGAYAVPGGAAFYAALVLIAVGGYLLWSRKMGVFGWVVAAFSPILMFPALYSIMGESEEVISLYAQNEAGEAVDLRLWIVDREDGAWLGMPRAKAVAHNLDGSELQMLRRGELVCVVPVLHDDRPTVKTIHAMKVEKYAVARIAGSIGLYPLEAPDTTSVLRLDAC